MTARRSLAGAARNGHPWAGRQTCASREAPPLDCHEIIRMGPSSTVLYQIYGEIHSSCSSRAYCSMHLYLTQIRPYLHLSLFTFNPLDQASGTFVALFPPFARHSVLLAAILMGIPQRQVSSFIKGKGNKYSGITGSHLYGFEITLDNRSSSDRCA